MSIMRKVVMVSVVAALAFAAGCDKPVKLSITNRTDQVMPVVITPPGEIPQLAGTLMPNGMVYYQMKIKNDLLPASVAWKIGDRQGQFTVTKDSDEKQYMYVNADGVVGPTSEKHEITQTKNLETTTPIQVEQHEVIK